MKIATFALIICVLATFVLMPRAYSHASGNEQLLVRASSSDDPLISLTSTNQQIRWKALEQMEKGPHVSIDSLLVILRGTNADIVKVDAAIVLGRYRATNAVPDLIEHLDLDSAGRPDHIIFGSAPFPESQEMNFPILAALMAIGKPAIPQCLDKITQTDDPITRKKCGWICNRVEGSEAAESRLKSLLEKETDTQKRARLEAALEDLEEFKKNGFPGF
jgi:hypothetical protein